MDDATKTVFNKGKLDFKGESWATSIISLFKEKSK